MTAQGPKKPTKAELAAAEGRHLPDIIGPDLRVLFCGINPGLYSAALGHHFARPGNRFWIALHAGGFTNRVLPAWQDCELLKHYCGLTNLVERATAGADALGSEELRSGWSRLEAKALAHRPRWIAILGIGAYRTAFAQPHAKLDKRAGTAAVESAAPL